MISCVKRISLLCAVGTLAVLSVIQPSYAYEASFVPSQIPENLPSIDDLGELLTLVINYFIGLVGLIAVLMLVIGGLRYLTSGGNEQTIEKAKHTILYAIIGIVLVLLSYAIVYTLTSSLQDL